MALSSRAAVALDARAVCARGLALWVTESDSELNARSTLTTAIMQVLSKSCTLQGVTVTKEDVHVNPNPLLDKYRKECCSKAEGEGHKPESVQTDVK